MVASLRHPAHQPLETLLPPASQVDSSARATPSEEQFPATLPTMPAPPPSSHDGFEASPDGSPTSMVRTLRSPPPVAWDELEEDAEPSTEKVPTPPPES